jgi:hypothetical protein
VISNERIDQFPANGDVSHRLLVLDVSDDDDGLDPREEVLDVEDDSQLPNSKSTVPNNCSKVIEANQIL